MNKKLIVPILSAAFMSCASVGATYALFTSESSAEVIVQSGKVCFAMEISNFKTYSGEWNSTNSRYEYVETETGKFANGGTATLQSNVLTLDKVTPMDKVEFDVSFVNDSTVSSKVRLSKEILSNNGLFEGLEVKIDDQVFDGMTDYGPWNVIEAGQEIEGYHVTACFPETEEDQNKYQNKTCKIKFGLDAVQANAHVTSLPEGADIGIYNANDLMIYGRGVEAINAKYTHKTAVLMNDIDMTGLEWTPVNVWSKGITFDGLGHVISNLKIKDGYHGSGFFTGGNTLLLKNVTFDSASVTGIGQVGVAVGNGDCAKIENVTVKNSTIKAVVTNNDDGDKAGAIVGYLCYDGGTAYLKNSKVENCVVEGYRDVGGAVGIANGACVVDNVEVKNTQIIANKLNNYKGYDSDDKFDIHEVIGETTSSAIVSNISFKDITFNELKPAALSGDTAQLTGDTFKAGDTAQLPEGTVKISNVSNNIDVKGTRDEDGNITTTINALGTGSIASVPNGSTFTDVALDCGQNNYHGFQHAGLMVFKDCEIKDLLFSYGDMIFENCTFTQTKVDGEYNMWAYGNDLLFKNCTFNSYGKFINVYNEGAGEYTVTFEGCTFNNLGEAKKAAVNVKETCGSKLLGNRTVITNCTTTGAFPEAKTTDTLIVFNSLVQVDDRNTDAGRTGNVKVTYNGTLIYANGVAQ